MAKARRQSNEELDTRLSSLETPKKFQIKTLPANITTTTTNISSLRFNNLEIGKTYRLTAHAYFSFTNTGDSDFTAVHNGVDILYMRWSMNSASNEEDGAVTHPGSVIFTATANTLTFDFTTPGGGQFNGNGTTAQSFVMLEEIDAEQTSQWT